MAELKKERTPYQRSREQKKPYANIKIDFRTMGKEAQVKGKPDGDLCLHLYGPVTREEAMQIKCLLLKIAKRKIEPEAL